MTEKKTFLTNFQTQSSKLKWQGADNCQIFLKRQEPKAEIYQFSQNDMIGTLKWRGGDTLKYFSNKPKYFQFVRANEFPIIGEWAGLLLSQGPDPEIPEVT